MTKRNPDGTFTSDSAREAKEKQRLPEAHSAVQIVLYDRQIRWMKNRNINRSDLIRRLLDEHIANKTDTRRKKRLERLKRVKLVTYWPTKGPQPYKHFVNGTILQLITFVAGEPWSENPKTADPALAKFINAWSNDLKEEANRQRTNLFKRYAYRLCDTNNSESTSEQRRFMMLNWLTRDLTTHCLKWAGLNDAAQQLEALTPIQNNADIETTHAEVASILENTPELQGPFNNGEITEAYNILPEVGASGVQVATMEHTDLATTSIRLAERALAIVIKREVNPKQTAPKYEHNIQQVFEPFYEQYRNSALELLDTMIALTKNALPDH